MTTSQSADAYGFRKLTKKTLLESCKKNKLYRTPSLNDVLYLHYQGFEDIESLEEYTGLKCIWLECNAISKISGLDNQKLLKCLFLHNNVIKKIENLEYCPELDTINLSHNHIIKIENCGIDKLPVLTSLNLSHNYLKSYDSLLNLIDCKMLSVLDIANNRIDDILCVKIFAQMPELRVLVLQGNPVVNQIPQYRKTLILDCLNLTYLDSRPVFPRDRACAEAWKQGGYEAERIEHARWNREERKKIRHSVNATLRLKNRGGGDPQPQLLMSSDDEDAGITELSSAPSLEKDQMIKTGSSSQALKSSDEDQDSEEEFPCSIPLFKMNTENIETPSLFNAEQRCIVCSRTNCNDEHKKKRKRIRNAEEPEMILENSFIFNQETTINNDEENKLYNDVYQKNIQYINESVSADELKNETDDKNFSINISRQETVDIAELLPSDRNLELSKDVVNITDNEKANTPHNLSQLLVRSHDEDSDITDLSSAPPMKKCKLNEQDDSPFHTDESLADCSQYNLSDEHKKKLKQEKETENIFENSSNFNSDVVNLDIVEGNFFTKTNILYDNIYKTNNEYISEIIENEVIVKTIEGILGTSYVEHNNSFLSETDITNIETGVSVSYINSKNQIKHEQPDADSKTNAENIEICKIDIETNYSSGLNMISKNEIKHNAVVESNNKITTDNIKNITEEALLQNDNVKDQPLNDNCALKLYLNTLPAVFSSRLYLGTDTKINSAIALYEMNHRKEYNSESESDEIETSITTIRNKIKKSNISITNAKNIESENLEPKMEIINRLLNNPITKTFKYDSSKINKEFKNLKDNDSTTLNEFIENQNKNIEINNQSDSAYESRQIGIYVSKSEETILQKNSDRDDESKNMIETHSSDTRISKINY